MPCLNLASRCLGCAPQCHCSSTHCPDHALLCLSCAFLRPSSASPRPHLAPLHNADAMRCNASALPRGVMPCRRGALHRLALAKLGSALPAPLVALLRHCATIRGRAPALPRLALPQPHSTALPLRHDTERCHACAAPCVADTLLCCAPPARCYGYARAEPDTAIASRGRTMPMHRVALPHNAFTPPCSTLPCRNSAMPCRRPTSLCRSNAVQCIAFTSLRIQIDPIHLISIDLSP